MNDTYITNAEILEIEERARQLRAEALRYGLGKVANWVKSIFTYRGQVASQPA